MNNKKEAVSFREQYEEQCKTREANENSWFGIISGTALFVIGMYQALCVDGFRCILFYIMAGIGAILLLSGSFFPFALKTPVALIKKIFGFIGKYILRILLLPVYLVMTIINLFTHRSYSKKFNFLQWNEDGSVTSEFSEYENIMRRGHRYALLGIVSEVFSVFINRRMFIIIPVVTVLLILGAIMFFASSSAVFSFVYTLF